jgi:bifunctional non-homologous end joining protein LigD
VGLAEYNRKRNFTITSEPRGDGEARERPDGARAFVIQKHAASHLHYDFRLELDGVLKSWSVPKGPNLDPQVKRLAMMTEDHPIAYADFEGIIPKGQYGGGTVLLWDQGTWEPQGANPYKELAAGNLKFRLKGKKLSGGFALVRIGDRAARQGAAGRAGDRDGRSWLLIKERDGEARSGGAADVPALRPESVTTGRTIEDIAADRSRVWHSKPAHLDPSAEPGAREARMPAKLAPPRAVARKAPPAGDGWLHEMAVAGTRVLARVDGDEIRLMSEKGAPIAAATARKLKWVADAARMLPASSVIVDGVVAPIGEGSAQEGYFVDDLVYLDGFDLRATPLERRKALLAELVRRIPERGPVRYLDHIAGAGEEFHREAGRLGIPAMISRRADSRYDARAGWARVTCDAPAAKTTATKRRAGPKANKTNTTAKPSTSIALTHPDRVLWPDVEGANGPGFTKVDLAAYYESIADFVLPHVVGRPLTLVRCPEGLPAKPDPSGRPTGCFYMKHSGVWAPRALERVKIQEKTKVGDYLVVRDLDGLLSLVQMSILEIHVWNAVAERLEQPDRVIFDLDPDSAVPWATVVETAFELRRRLEALGLESVVKTTGGKGLHVVVPFAAGGDGDESNGWDDALAFSRAVAERLERERPEAFITKMSKAARAGRIFIDYLRNQRGNTAIAGYSTRTRPAAPVAVPLAWDELGPKLDPRSFTVSSVPTRLARLKKDPWAAALKTKQRLTPALLARVVARG